MIYNKRSLYKTLKNKKILDKGTRGIVFINDDDTLIKVPREIEVNMTYSTYLNSLERLKKSRIEFENYGAMQRIFMEKGNNLDFFDSAKDMVFLDTMYIGVIIKWYKDCMSLMDYKYTSEQEFLEIVKRIIENNKILIDRGIYHLDLLLNNILYNGKDMHIIDIDGIAIKYFPEKNKEFENFSYYSIFIGLNNYLESKYINEGNIADRSGELNYILEKEYNSINYKKAKRMIKKIEEKGIFKR